MYQSILVAVDGSEANKLAVNTAIEIAKTRNAKLTAICVFDTGSYTVFNYSLKDEIPYMEEKIDEALVYVKEAASKAGVNLEIIRSMGKAADVIIDESAKHDLLIVGTHGRTGMTHAIMGSVAEKVARFSKSPVMICR